jgi:hypothetical protein
MLRVLVILSLATPAYASVEHCNQRLYDAIYKRITQEALNRRHRALTDDEDRLVSLRRIEEINGLRLLCNGQKSTYETGGKQ